MDEKVGVSEQDAEEREIEALSQRTKQIAQELSRRLHQRIERARDTIDRVRDVAETPARVVRNPFVIGGLVLSGAAIIGFGIARAIRNRGFTQRIKRRALKMAGKVASEAQPSMAERILVGATVALIGAFGKQLAGKLIQQRMLPAHRELPAHRV